MLGWDPYLDFYDPQRGCTDSSKEGYHHSVPQLSWIWKKRMALEKAVKEDEKRAQKREKLLKEMKNATGEMKTTSPTNEAAKTKDESKSSLQAVRDAKAKLAQQEKTATRPGSAHGSTPDDATETSKPNKKDKKAGIKSELAKSANYPRGFGLAIAALVSSKGRRQTEKAPDRTEYHINCRSKSERWACCVVQLEDF